MPEDDSITNCDRDRDRQERNRRDIGIIEQHADRLNREAADVLDFQQFGTKPVELSREAQEKFAQLILNPGPLAPALRRAMERRKSFLVGLS